MKIGPLPKDLDLRGLASRGVTIQGTASVEALPRLCEAGIGLEKPVVGAFRFSRDEEARYLVETSINASLTLVCQRCLEKMVLPLTTGSRLACVWSDVEAETLPSGLEPLLVGELADLNEIAEEEILLAVPVAPIHQEDCVTEPGGYVPDEEPLSRAAPDKESPFSVLKKLRT
tara:strand:- start:136 stop:654 length:519 start_codon:yes stop_codon:yes gene_type:complete